MFFVSTTDLGCRNAARGKEYKNLVGFVHLTRINLTTSLLAFEAVSGSEFIAQLNYIVTESLVSRLLKIIVSILKQWFFYFPGNRAVEIAYIRSSLFIRRKPSSVYESWYLPLRHLSESSNWSLVCIHSKCPQQHPKTIRFRLANYHESR
jgi:hypothetical protein